MSIGDTLTEMNKKLDLREKQIEDIKLRLVDLGKKMKEVQELKSSFMEDFFKLFPELKTESVSIESNGKKDIMLTGLI